MASTLVEIKSRLLLPHADEVEDEIDDPRQELVRRLLEYKQFKDAASILDERAREWQERFPRQAGDLTAEKRDPADEPIRELELWDLVSAFGRLIQQHQSAQPSSIVYDDTPIHVYMDRIHQLLEDQPRLAFTELFQPGMHKSTLIGMFFGCGWSWSRHRGLHAEQSDLFGEIWLVLDPAAPPAVPTRTCAEAAPPSSADSKGSSASG